MGVLISVTGCSCRCMHVWERELSVREREGKGGRSEVGKKRGGRGGQHDGLYFCVTCMLEIGGAKWGSGDVGRLRIAGLELLPLGC